MLDLVDRKRHPIKIRLGKIIMRVRVSTLFAQGRPSNQHESPDGSDSITAKERIENMSLRFGAFISFGNSVNNGLNLTQLVVPRNVWWVLPSMLSRNYVEKISGSTAGWLNRLDTRRERG